MYDDIYRLIDQPPLDIYIIGWRWLFGRRDLELSCLYDIVDKRLKFMLKFKGCEKVTFEMYGHFDDAEKETLLVGFRIADITIGHRVLMTTNHFEIVLQCESMIVIK